MNWETFYLVCFVVGFVMSAASFLMGFFHLPHLHGHLHLFGHSVDLHAGHGAGHGAASPNDFHVSPFNFGSLMVFLTWFGATGYVLTHYSVLWGVLGAGVSVAAGIAGAAVVFWFLARVLTHPEENLDPDDYVMVGTLGRLTVAIREGGTGEIVYTQGGTRKSAGARCEDTRSIEKGTEVVITRYEKGIAYVQRWEELAGEGSTTEAQGAGK
jgi:membrane protein implicated in regulation of membrane protease activity